ncbi:hypothetical protein N7G274_002684 [Stereocaulon virgatum]|uniref:F-box domain-containing protein n=1 Tax=Stereocaulon virgatum TaxID=373712 RepID=A0ABR4AGJ1_9LECA
MTPIKANKTVKAAATPRKPAFRRVLPRRSPRLPARTNQAMTLTKNSNAVRAATTPRKPAVSRGLPRRSPRLLARANQAGTDPSTPKPNQKLWLQDLPIDMLYEISTHLADDKPYYILTKPHNQNWKLVIDPKRPGHNPPGGRAIINPRRYGFQFIHHYRPQATFAATYPEFGPYIQLPQPALAPQALDVFFLVEGVERRSALQYQIQEQHMIGWGVVTEVGQGPNVEWPRGIPFAL